MFDSYTVKKVLPRLFIAIVLIQLSWFLFTGVIKAVNLVAYGVEGLIYAPFEGLKNQGLADILSSIGGGTGLGLFSVMAAAATGVIVAVAVGGILMTAGIVLLGVLIAFALLLFRQVMVVGLLIIAPLALVAWILPSTEKYWKLWWDTFFKLLLVYPIILGMIAIGRVMGSIVAEVDPASGTWSVIDDMVTFIFVIACVIGPFFLIPKTFQMAGGAFAALSGAVNNRGAGAKNWMKKRRGAKMAQNWDNAKSGKRFKGSNALTRGLNKGIMSSSLAGQAGIDPRKWRGRIRAARSERISASSAKAGESAAAQAVMSNDDLLDAAIAGRGTEGDARAYLEGIGQRGRELDQNVASIMRAKQDLGKEAFEDHAAAALAGTGTGYASGPASMLQAINRVAGNDSARSARILASARSQAEKARRVDLYGAGFAASADQMGQLRNGTTNADTVNEVLTDEALNSKSAGEVATSRNNALRNMQGAVMRRLDRSQEQVEAAKATGDQQTIETARHVQKQAIAATSSFLDIAGSASPENAQVVGALMGQEMSMTVADPSGNQYDKAGNLVSSGVRTVSKLGEAIEALESDPEYKQYKKTYKDEHSATLQAQAQSAAQHRGNLPPPGTPPYP